MVIALIYCQLHFNLFLVYDQIKVKLTKRAMGFFYTEKLGPGTNTKPKSKIEALGQSISQNLVYTSLHSIAATKLSTVATKLSIAATKLSIAATKP